MTIAIPLEAPRFAVLQQEATDLGVTVEQLAADIIDRHIRIKTAPGSAVSDDAFKTAMEATLRENDELYRRLAREAK
jgi:hypothetical protein